MRSPWYTIVQLAVLVAILAACASLAGAQGGCCAKVHGCKVPSNCYCPFLRSICRDGGRRHIIGGKRSGTLSWNYSDDGDQEEQRAQEDNEAAWNEAMLLAYPEREINRPLDTRTVVRNLIRRLGADPDLLMMALKTGQSQYDPNQDFEV